MPIEPPKLVTQSEYARLRGVSPAAVFKAIASGRISYLIDDKGRVWLDARTADREWRANTDPAFQQRPRERGDLE